VVHGAVGEVEPPEDQSLAGRVEVGAPGGGGQGRDVALVQRLGGTDLRGAEALPLAGGRLPAQLVQPGVGAVEVLLLAPQLSLEGVPYRAARGLSSTSGPASSACRAAR